MKAIETPIPGVLIIESDIYTDERGSVTPAWIADDFQALGLPVVFGQCNIVRNHRRGTLRGLHYQQDPFSEVKLIRALHGSIFDVAVDLRPDSPTYCRWTAIELRAGEPRMFYLPRGIAHGYQTLEDQAEVMYFVSPKYSGKHQRGVRWDDPVFAIKWPISPPVVIHPRDAAYPDFVSSALRQSAR